MQRSLKRTDHYKKFNYIFNPLHKLQLSIFDLRAKRKFLSKLDDNNYDFKIKSSFNY